MTSHPTDHLRRSPVYRKLEAAGAAFRTLGDTAIAASVPGEQRPLGLLDLSPLPRSGFKGPRALEGLAALGLAVPKSNNQATVSAAGAYVLRLSDTELLLLSKTDGGGALEAYEGLAIPGCYAAPRRDSHAWILLAGPESAPCLAKLCGVDLRSHVFGDRAVAQTSLARLSGIVARDDRFGPPAYHVLVDRASAPYLWDCLLDAMREFGGGPAGVDDLMDSASA